MLVTCPQCGTANQEPGKYCENCGHLIPADAGLATPDAIAQPAGTSPDAQPAPATTLPITSPQAASAAPAAGAQTLEAHFAVVHGDQANPQEGFTITRPGEFLVGRVDLDTQTGVDIDLRQWVTPIDVNGQKQYLVHRKQCYIGLGADGQATIRPVTGTENDTLIRPVGSTDYIPLSQLSTVRQPGPESTFPLEPGDRLYMGDPETLQIICRTTPTRRAPMLCWESARCLKPSSRATTFD